MNNNNKITTPDVGIIFSIVGIIASVLVIILNVIEKESVGVGIGLLLFCFFNIINKH